MYEARWVIKGIDSSRVCEKSYFMIKKYMHWLFQPHTCSVCYLSSFPAETRKVLRCSGQEGPGVQSRTPSILRGHVLIQRTASLLPVGGHLLALKELL